MPLTFTRDFQTDIACSCCKAVKRFKAKDETDARRWDHTFDWIIASIRAQGWNDGYLCKKCAKSKKIDYSDTRARCKKYLTRSYFLARRGMYKNDLKFLGETRADESE